MAKSKGKDKKDEQSPSAAEAKVHLNSAEEVKAALMNVRDKLLDGSGPPIYALTTLNYLLTAPNIYQVLNDENKELARSIWLQLKSAGFHVKTPPILFGDEEDIRTNP